MTDEEKLADIDNIFEEFRIILDKVIAFANKLERLVKLVQQVDGNIDILKNSLWYQNLKRELDYLLINHPRVYPPGLNHELALRTSRMDLSAYEMTYNSLYEKYNPCLDELIDLYQKKDKLKKRAEGLDLGDKLPIDSLSNNIVGVKDVPKETNKITEINSEDFMNDVNSKLGGKLPTDPLSNNNFYDAPTYYPVNDSSHFTK